MSIATQKATPDLTAARRAMIESQLRPNMVRDERILTAMETLPREIFVPSMMAGIAYIDEDLQVAPNRYLLEPMVLARLLEEAKIKPTDRVLDIAVATGYSSAVLSVMAKEVVAVESDVALHGMLAINIGKLGAQNIAAQSSNLAEGCPSKAPYDVIIINGGVEVLPPELLVQLSEGGRLLAVVRQYGPAHAAHTGEARLYEKVGGVVSHRALFDANVKPLPGFQAPAQFKF